MTKITDITQLNKLVSSAFKVGVLTNCNMTPEKWKEEIKKGLLYFNSFDGGVLFFKKRDFGFLMNYYIYDLQNVSKEYFTDEIYTEVVMRENDSINIFETLKTAGFEHLFTRIRLKNVSKEQNSLNNCRIAPYKDIYSLMLSCFDEKTACIPSLEQLEKAAQNKMIIFKTDEKDKVIGFIHAQAERKKAEIRHLAVKENQRGKGIAKELVKEFNSRFKDYQKFVWVREDNEPAKHIYKKLGFEPDGFKSMVMCNNGRKIK